eukprot:Skav206100  [mRNA]  locus=scaffold2150:373946:378610:- [translate_table: standard]
MTSYGHMQALLSAFDIMGLAGSERYNGKFLEHRNLLLGEVKPLDENHDRLFTATIFRPEGGSATSFDDLTANLDVDKPLNNRITFAWLKEEEPPVFAQKFFLLGAKDAFHDWRDDDAEFVVEASTRYVPLHSSPCSVTHVFEPFSGGVGGWSSAADFMRTRFNQDIQIISMDACIRACHNFAMNHPCTLIDAHHDLPLGLLSQLEGDILMHGELESLCWLSSLAEWDVHVMTVSAPCPPWSNASYGPGVSNQQGQLLPTAFLLCRFLRPRIVLIEQVNGFNNHRDRDWCLACLKHVGYRLEWKRVVNTSDFGGTVRYRWLGVAVKANDCHIRIQRFQMWPVVSQLSPLTLDALFDEVGPDQQSLSLTPEALKCATDVSMLPRFMKKRPLSKREEDVLYSRCTAPDETTATFMSMYFSQHELDEGYLKEKGYLGHFLVKREDGQKKVRYFHPFEGMLIHLATERFYVPNNFVEAFHQVGNQISLPHALLLFSNVMSWICDDATFDVNMVFHALLRDRLTIHNVVHFQHEQGFLYVHGSRVTDENRDDFAAQLAHLQELVRATNLGNLAPEVKWNAKSGFGMIRNEQHPEQGTTEQRIQAAQCFSPVSVSENESVDNEEIATAPFQVMLKFLYEVDSKSLYAWISSQADHNLLAHTMRTQLEIKDTPQACHATSLAIKPIGLHSLIPPTGSQMLLPVVQEDFMSFELIQDECTEDFFLRMTSLFDDQKCYDQFGLVKDDRQMNSSLILLPTEISYEEPRMNPCFLLTAAQQCESSAIWDPAKGCIVFKMVGPATAVELLSEFWANTLSFEVLQNMFASVDCTTIAGTNEIATIRFASVQGGFPIPPLAWEHVLGVAAVRRSLSTLSNPSGASIRIKWMSRTLWEGQIDPNIQVDTLLSMIDIAFAPFHGEESVRLVVLGKVYYKVTIQELMEQFQKTTLVFHLIFRMVGGAGTKDTQRTYIKNSIAASLLQQGFPMDWTANSVDTLMKNVGMKRLTQVTTMPPGRARTEQTLQLCRDCALVIPDKVFNEASSVSNKAAQNNRAKKRIAVQPNPQHYQLETSFLVNEDGSNPTQLQTLQPNLCGIILMSLEQAMPWISEGQTISRDELAVAIVGTHTLQTSLTCSHCNMPCRDHQGTPVILAVTLIQLGARKIATVNTEKHVDEEKCQTIAITLWQEDFPAGEWTNAIDHSIGFVRGLLRESNHEEAIESIWGRSVRGVSHKDAGDMSAQSLQLHAAVRQDRLNELLRVSGFNKLFITPKDREGRPAAEWRIIWLEGSLAHLTSMSTQVENCMGLTRNRKSWGLRFHKDHFDKAWGTLCSDKPKPSDMQLKYIYRVEPLPFGATADMLKKWASVLSWNLRPLKAMGPRTWIVGSDSPCPEGVVCFNSNPVIIKLLPPRVAQSNNAVVAGPKPRTGKPGESKTSDDPWAAWQDPWAAGLTQKATPSSQPPARTVQGPIESRFSQQDQRLELLEQAVGQLRSDTEQGFQQVEMREKNTHDVIARVKHDLESSFTQAISQQSNQLNSTLSDLKALLTKRSKRDRKDRTADEEDDDMSGTG